ncbi:MAG TPA: flagellar motor protein MotB [Candidatus Hydrogenedentes bacterium]|nr:flagellar motor protein MotB [Candidatus Hydrogenedentota bacterium]HPC15430.1 flagellar motor protein MotB [Candidatus Hydrogenedentota bacterium]HRT21131.1 flagellar motor protein MotB [Candidatus Hydrogenedentota bacterium]HRT64356.1 flagellar motor protein MotB [Candidatus Hydrogenedentota bacterium]
MHRRRFTNPVHPAAPGWMVTYGDLMSLLLVFFILLAAYSTVNEKKLREALESFQRVLGVTPADDRGGGDWGRVAREVQRRVQILGKTHALRVTFDAGGGVVFTLPTSFLFDGESATLREEANDVMQALADGLAMYPSCRATIKGHTDDRPLREGSAYRDLMDMSFARADAVARRLQAAGKLPMDAFEIVACGAGRPRAVNTSEEGREANRRIEILVSGAGKHSTMGREAMAEQ